MFISELIVCYVFAGIWLGIYKQHAQHMGAALCLLDLSLHRSNTGGMDFSWCLSSSSEEEEASEEKAKLR